MAKRFKPRRSDNFFTRIPEIFKDELFDVPMALKGTYTQNDFVTRIGQWLEFKTPWGTHRGIIETVKKDSVLVKMPIKSLPSAWVNYVKSAQSDFQLAGFDGCHPHERHQDGCHPHGCFKQGPWFWCWLPIIAILFIFPGFCW